MTVAVRYSALTYELCCFPGGTRAREKSTIVMFCRRVVGVGCDYLAQRVLLGQVWLFGKVSRGESRVRSSTRGQKGREATAPGLSLGALQRPSVHLLPG